MKIGLLTYHHVVNPGSVLQAFCAYKLLSLFFPKARIEIIDYVPEASQAYNAKQAEGRPSWNVLTQEYECFLRTHCQFSNWSLRQDNLANGAKRISHARYDLIVVGSDTVFQVDGYLGNYIAGPKAPNLYYLPGIKAARKLGLAVSFDPPQAIDPAIKPQLATALREFDHILYRDEHAEHTLQAMDVPNDRLGYIPDPTIMVDIATLIPESPHHPAEQTNKVGVSISNGQIREAVCGWLCRKGMEPVDLMRLDYLGRQPSRLQRLFKSVDATVFPKRLRVYREVAGMITDRFHGSIFALQLGDYPVVGIEDANNYPEQQGKLRDLYSRLSLSDSFIRVEQNGVTADQLETAWQCSQSRIPDRRIRFAELRLQGFKSLRDALLKTIMLPSSGASPDVMPVAG